MELLEQRCVPATFTVISFNDSGSGTLREAIGFANDEINNPGLDTIEFFAGMTGTISQSSADDTTYGPTVFLITSKATIDGCPDGFPSSITLERDAATSNLRLFRVAGTGGLTLNRLTV